MWLRVGALGGSEGVLGQVSEYTPRPRGQPLPHLGESASG